jgi:hypothetical protein
MPFRRRNKVCQDRRMKRGQAHKLLGFAGAAAVALSACGGSGGSSADVSVIANTTAESLTTTTEVSATTAAPIEFGPEPTTAVTSAEPKDILENQVVQDFQSAEGWKYRIGIAPILPNPEKSVAECIDVAPPGSTNLRYVMVIENLLSDRAAPYPTMSFSLNLTPDGTTLEPRAGDLEVKAFDLIEVDPNAPGTRCFNASVLWPGTGSDAQSIPAGEREFFLITAGPVSDPPIDGTALQAFVSARDAVTQFNVSVPFVAPSKNTGNSETVGSEPDEQCIEVAQQHQSLSQLVVGLPKGRQLDALYSEVLISDDLLDDVRRNAVDLEASCEEPGIVTFISTNSPSGVIECIDTGVVLEDYAFPGVFTTSCQQRFVFLGIEMRRAGIID